MTSSVNRSRWCSCFCCCKKKDQKKETANPKKEDLKGIANQALSTLATQRTSISNPNVVQVVPSTGKTLVPHTQRTPSTFDIHEMLKMGPPHEGSMDTQRSSPSAEGLPPLHRSPEFEII